ncbi:hypothetical protein [Streptomyces sp. NPDC046759]|uniref:hypothetical protein n=1 Tax=Streptomyces sp. NPDC046759 TaxID=3155019 RepID=UPI0034016BAE
MSDLTRHRARYGAQGVFLDQVSTGIEQLGVCEQPAAVVRTLGRGPLVLHHGTAPHAAYAAPADLLVTFEGPWTT